MRSNKKKEQWLIDQYNRNRPFCEWVMAYNEIKLNIKNKFKQRKDGN